MFALISLFSFSYVYQSSGSNTDVQSKSVEKQMEMKTLPDMVGNISKESNPKTIMENKLSNNGEGRGYETYLLITSFLDEESKHDFLFWLIPFQIKLMSPQSN